MTHGFPTLSPNGPVLVFGGPYGNLQATQAVLGEASRRGIPASNIICTGDLIAYCGSPRETIALIRASRITVVMGNCDEQLALGASDCACGYPTGSTCDLLSAQWYAYAGAQIGPNDRAWLGGLPKRIDLIIGGRRIAVIHGTVRTINAYVFPSTPVDEKRAQIDHSRADGVIGGHSGLPFSQVVGGRLWHNAGVIGMPANDGSQRVWYSVLTPSGPGLRIDHCSLTYDAAAAARTMQQAGLPDPYRLALKSGIWPSNDVLPEQERQQQGVPLQPSSLTWVFDQARVA